MGVSAIVERHALGVDLLHVPAGVVDAALVGPARHAALHPRRVGVGKRVEPVVIVRVVAVPCAHRPSPDAEVLDGAGDDRVAVDLEHRAVDQHAARVAVRVVGVADQRRVQNDAFGVVVATIGDGHEAPPARPLGLIQVVHHEPAPAGGLSGGQVRPAHALRVAAHRVVAGIERRHLLRQVPPHEVEGVAHARDLTVGAPDAPLEHGLRRAGEDGGVGPRGHAGFAHSHLAEADAERRGRTAEARP